MPLVIQLENQPIPFSESRFKRRYKQLYEVEGIHGKKADFSQYVTCVNRSFVICLTSSNFFWVFKSIDDEAASWQSLSKNQLQAIFHPFELIPAKGKKKRETVFDVWFKNMERNCIQRFVFDPSLPSGFIRFGEDSLYNYWMGFPEEFTREPTGEHAAELDIILFHLRYVLCRDEDVIFYYVLAWMAQLIQHPEIKIPVVLAFSGLQGAGKSLFWKYFRKLFGVHSECIPDPNMITERFCAGLADKVFLLVDETKFDNKADANKVKSQITSDKRRSEKKFQDQRLVKDYIRMVFTSNDKLKCFPAEVGSNRRFLSVEVDGSRANEKGYFDRLIAAFEGEGLCALWHFLKGYESDVNLQMPPHTEEKSDIVAVQLNSFDQWWLKCLGNRTNQVPYGTNWVADPLAVGWLVKNINLEFLWDAFKKFAPPHEHWNELQFQSSLKDVLPALENGGTDLGEALKNRQPFFDMPTWHQCNNYFHIAKGLKNSQSNFVPNRKRKFGWNEKEDEEKMGDIRKFFQ